VWRAIRLAGHCSALKGASHVKCPASGRCRRPAPLACNDASVSRRQSAPQQRPAYPADPPTVDEIVAVMRHAGRVRYGPRLNALIVVIWRAGLRTHEALSLPESDLDQNPGSILVRHGKNDRRRELGMDAWAWTALKPWLLERTKLPVGPLFCVTVGPTCGHR
jgi:integrase